MGAPGEPVGRPPQRRRIQHVIRRHPAPDQRAQKRACRQAALFQKTDPVLLPLSLALTRENRRSGHPGERHLGMALAQPRLAEVADQGIDFAHLGEKHKGLFGQAFAEGLFVDEAGVGKGWFG